MVKDKCDSELKSVCFYFQLMRKREEWNESSNLERICQLEGGQAAQEVQQFQEQLRQKEDLLSLGGSTVIIGSVVAEVIPVEEVS